MAGLVLLSGCTDKLASAPGSGGHAERGPAKAAETAPGSEAATAVGAVNAMFAAYAAKDLSRWLGSWSDEGFASTFGVPKAEAALVPPSWGNLRSFRESEVTLREISDERLGDDRGSVVVETGELGVLTWHRLDLGLLADRWRVTGRTPVPAPATDLPVLDVTLADDSIRYTGVAGSDLNLRVTNGGSIPHELLLLRGRGGVDETVGRVVALDPGSGSTLRARELSSGTYSLVCNLLDPEGRPHSAKGMRAVIQIS